MQELLVGFLGLLFGAILVGLGVFFWMLLGAVNKLTQAAMGVAPLGKILSPGQVQQVLAVATVLPDLARGLEGLNKTMSVFTQLAFTAPQATGGVTADKNSGFYGYNETEAANRERVDQAVSAGVPKETAEEALEENAVISEV